MWLKNLPWLLQRISDAINQWPQNVARTFASEWLEIADECQVAHPILIAQFERIAPNVASSRAKLVNRLQKAEEEFQSMINDHPFVPVSIPTRKILVVSITGNERKAILKSLSERQISYKEHFDQEWQGHEFIYPTEEEAAVLVQLVRLDDQRAPEAAHKVGQWIKSLAPDAVLMVGMCMGIKGRVELGTVIAPNEIFSLSHCRDTPDGTKPIPHSYRANDTARRRLSSILDEPKSNFTFSVKQKQSACGDLKIENMEGETYKNLQSLSTDIVAYEMEGEGFFHALKEERVEALLIKGVADLGDFSSTSSMPPADREQAKNEAQSIAVNNAFQVALAWIKHFASYPYPLKTQ